MTSSADDHFDTVIQAIKDGRVIPFLGAGANLCDRSPAEHWRFGHHQILPSGRELAYDLAQHFQYPAKSHTIPCPNCRSKVEWKEEALNLVHVSQYAALKTGPGALYDRLHKVFDADFPPSTLHYYLASLPSELQKMGKPVYLIIVTTNWDDVLERTFSERNEEFDLVKYVRTKFGGYFLHISPDGVKNRIVSPSDYNRLPIDKSFNLYRTIIIKIHGAIDRHDDAEDSFVVTEDDYIDYLAHTDVIKQLPRNLAVKLQRSHFLFLGYSLMDWNLRVVLCRIWEEQDHRQYRSWAVQLGPDLFDLEFWRDRGVEIKDMPLKKYIQELSQRL